MDPFALNLIMIIGFVLGSGLIIVEAFIPGFGIAGIAGIILEIAAIIFTNTWFGLSWSLIATFIVLLFIGITVFLSYRSAMKGRLSKSALILLLIGIAVFISYRSARQGRLSRSNLVLNATESAVEAKLVAEKWLDKEGVAVTALRPIGTIEAEGTRLNAASSGDFIEKGTAVIITGAEGDHLVVRRKA